MVVRLTVELADKSDWVKVYGPRDCTVFVATNNPPEVGVQVRVDVSIADGGPRVVLRGRVIARRAAEGDNLPAGCSVAIGFEDREKVNYLNGYVRGGLLNWRVKRRIPVRLRVTYGSLNGEQDTFTRDINEEGIFVITESPLPEQSVVHLNVHFPNVADPISLSGTVSHTVVVEDEDIPGMGIVFELDEARSQELNALIDSLERAFQQGELPEDLLI